MLVALAITSSGRFYTPVARSGDTYVEAMVGAPRLLNPLLATSDSERDLTHLLFSGLTRVDERGEIAPDLASGWESSPEGRVYTFTLKPNLRWHDGEALTADDVFFTLSTLLRSPEFRGDPLRAAPWRDVEVSALTPQVVRLTLPLADASFLQYTTQGILPRHLWSGVKVADLALSNLNRFPVGSGPWRSLSGSPPSQDATGLGDISAATPPPGSVPASEGILLEPFGDGAGSGQPITRLWFRLYPSFGAALEGFRLGEAHGLGHIPPERVAEVGRIGGISLHKQALARYTMLLLNVRSPLLDRAETRQALELAIDREALANGEAVGGRALGSPVLPGSWAYEPSVTPRPYNPTEAARLLDSAGWILGPEGVRVRDGVTLTLALAANADLPANVEVAQKIESYLRAVGVDARSALVSRESLLRDYLGPRQFHLALAGWEAPGADPDLYNYWHSSRGNVSGGLNFSGWSNPQADEALLAGRLALDTAGRKAQYAAFQKAFAADVPAIVLYSPMYTYATRLPARGVTLPTSEMLDPAYRFSRVSDWSLQADSLP